MGESHLRFIPPWSSYQETKELNACFLVIKVYWCYGPLLKNWIELGENCLSDILEVCLSNQFSYSRLSAIRAVSFLSRFHIYSSFHIYSLFRFCKRAVLCFVIAMAHYIHWHRKGRKSETEMSSVDARIDKIAKLTMIS